MALDIGVGDPNQLSFIDGEPVMEFDDDAYYWFLFPFFEALAKSTGQMFDLYDDAAFTGASIENLLGILKEARALAEKQPKSWLLHVGTRTDRTPTPIFEEINRVDLIERIQKLMEVAARAKSLGQAVVCVGD